MNPPARSSCWRLYGSKCYIEYTDMMLNCGGFDTLWNQNNGKCGICGDNWAQKPRFFEIDGLGYKGIIVNNYSVGQVIDVSVEITNNLKGWFEFRICNADLLFEQGLDANQDCLDKNLLKDINGNSRFPINSKPQSGLANYKLILPNNLICKHCVFQWKHNAGNNWGIDPETGISGLGFGKQEQYYGCADVSIGNYDKTSGKSTTTKTSRLMTTTFRSLKSITTTKRPITTTKKSVTTTIKLITTTKKPVTTTMRPLTTKLTTAKPTQLISQEEFNNALTKNGYEIPTIEKYTSFSANIKSKGNIDTKREAAMFLAQIIHESGGLKYKRELYCQNNMQACANAYPNTGLGYPGLVYYGRGYIQLTWDYNYNSASYDLYNDDRLLRDPEQVADNEEISWSTAFWYWKTRVGISQDVKNGKFGTSTNLINGALECNGQNLDKAKRRFEVYKVVLTSFNIFETPDETGCYN